MRSSYDPFFLLINDVCLEKAETQIILTVPNELVILASIENFGSPYLPCSNTTNSDSPDKQNLNLCEYSPA